MSSTEKHTSGSFALNVPKYFVYTALKGFGFAPFGAIWVIYLQQRRGLSLTEATLIDVAFFVAAALGEIPTGVVADAFGRKTSLMVGAALMGISALAWPFAPTVPLIMLAHVGLAIGNSFLSGAEEAFFYESLQATGRAAEYQRLTGRVQATMLGALALGSVTSGLLAGIDLIVPFMVAGMSILAMLGVVLTFKEAHAQQRSGEQVRRGYGEILRQSAGIMRDRPALRFPVLYLSIVPAASLIMETFFLQPQAVLLGVPIAGIGIIVMAMQITSMAGATASHRIATLFGEGRVLFTAPALIIASLVLLAALQTLPALLFIAAISFVTAALQPLLLSRIQGEVPDDIRATVLSMQSLTFTLFLAVSEPLLGVVADRSGLPAAYFAMSGGLGVLAVLLLRSVRPSSKAAQPPTLGATEQPAPSLAASSQHEL